MKPPFLDTVWNGQASRHIGRRLEQQPYLGARPQVLPVCGNELVLVTDAASKGLADVGNGNDPGLATEPLVGLRCDAHRRQALRQLPPVKICKRISVVDICTHGPSQDPGQFLFVAPLAPGVREIDVDPRGP